MKSWLGMVSMLEGDGGIQDLHQPRVSLKEGQRAGPRAKCDQQRWPWPGGGDGHPGLDPPVVAKVEDQHVLGILQLPGTLRELVVAQVLGKWEQRAAVTLCPTPKPED